MYLNIYDNPEKFGLEIVGEVEYSSGSYEFDMIAVWRDPQTKQLYWAADSGCSCPTPFDSYDRTNIVPATFHEVAEALQRHLDEGYHSEYARPAANEAKVANLLERLR